MELSGKVAVVTGASSGIGEATARALARQGMTVFAVARRAERLAALADAEPGIRAATADVTDDTAVKDLAETVTREVGALHVLVNNAGAGGGQGSKDTDGVDEAAEVADLNYLGTVRCMTAFRDLLAASAPSRVINVGSVAGKLAVGSPAYVASKFATVGFTEAVGPRWARQGIAVCQVNPGFIRTEGFPQTHLIGNPVTRRLVDTPEAVAAAIVEVAGSGRRERTVPRWYRPLVALRHVAAPLYFGAVKRMPL